MTSSRLRSRQSGMSLVEVLTAVLIFSLGIVGMMGLQSRAMQFSMSAEDTNRAALLANELASEMWAHRTVNLPEDTVTAWEERVARLAYEDGTPADGLPNGVGEVTVTDNVAEITVTWRAPHAAEGDTNRFVTQVMVPEVPAQ